MKLVAFLLAGALSLGAAQAHAQSSGAPLDPKRTPPTTTPPPKTLPEKMDCVVDRAWSCRRRGCLVDTRKVLVRIDTKARTACQLRGDKCRRVMTFTMTRQRGGISGAIAKRGMIFFIDGRYRITVAQLRRRRVFAVYGRCSPATD